MKNTNHMISESNNQSKTWTIVDYIYTILLIDYLFQL